MGFLRGNKTRLKIMKVAKSTGFLFLIIGFVFIFLIGNSVLAKTMNFGTSGDTILLNGSVGVGITNPQSVLHIYGGNGTVGSLSSGPKFVFQGPIDGASSAWASIQDIRSATYGSSLIFSTTNSASVTDNSSEKMRINESGNVGIGTTNPVSGKLQVSTATNSSAMTLGSNTGVAFSVKKADEGYGLHIGIAGSGTSWIQSGSTAGATAYDLSLQASGGHVLFPGSGIWNSSGNVGIGTTTPAVKLDVYGNIAAAGRPNIAYNMNAGSFGGNTYYAYNSFCVGESTGYCTGTGGTILGIANASAKNNIPTSGSVFFNNGGNVGVGTTTPASKFQVYGNGTYSASFTSGSVGIGTTAPTKLLEVSGEAKFNSFAWGVTPASSNTLALATVEYVNSYTLSSSTVSNKWTRDGDTVGSVKKIGTIDAYDLPFITSNAERMRILAGGNVGIGTAAPLAPLSVFSGVSAGLNEAIMVSGGSTAVNSGSSISFGNRYGTDTYPTWRMASLGAVFNSGVSFGGDLVFNTNGSGSQNTLTEKMRINYLGNVGIGTTNPLSKLDVTNGTALANADVIGTTGNFENSTPTGQGSTLSIVGNDAIAADIGGVLGFGGKYSGNSYANWASIKGLKADATSGNYGGYLSFWTRLTGAGNVERMRIDTAGNVGIGATNPGYKLDVSGSIRATGDVSSVSYWLQNNQAIRNTVTADSTGSTYLDLSNVYFRTANNGTNLMTILSNGNVGIGTTNPGYKLEVAGISLLGNGLETGAYIGTTGQAIWTRTGGKLVLYNNGSDRLIINNAGNVGIGETNPLSLLHVSGTGAEISLQDTGSSGTRWGLLSRRNNTAGLFSIYDYTNGRDGLVINSSGNVGIGTTNPGAQLEVAGANGFRIQARSTDPVYYTTFTQRYSGGGLDIVTKEYGQPDTTMVLYRGSVGIGTTTPDATMKLDVNGNIRAFGYVYNSSDRALKKNIVTIENPLEKIMQLRGVTFNWIKDNQPSVGLIAQEVEKVFPSVVTGVEGNKSVAYSNLVAPLIEAVKAQQKEIDALNLRLKKLEVKNKKK